MLFIPEYRLGGGWPAKAGCVGPPSLPACLLASSLACLPHCILQGLGAQAEASSNITTGYSFLFFSYGKQDANAIFSPSV